MGYFLACFVALLIILQRFSMNRDLTTLQVDLDADKKIVEPDEEFNLTVNLRNPGWSLYPYLSVNLNLPNGMELQSGQSKFSTWLLPRQQLNLKIPAVIRKRGRYLSQYVGIASGDFIGMDSQETRFPRYVEVVCIPRDAGPADLDKLPGGLYGEISVNRFIFEDPILSIGYREYTGREAQKQISWSQSARMGRLMVKQYDYTEDASVMIALNTKSDVPDKNFEDCFSLARSVCQKLEDMGVQYSFCTNAITEGDINSWAYVPSGLGPNHLMHILEGLGRCSYRFGGPMERMLNRAIGHNTNTYALLFLTPEGDPESVRKAELIARGHGIRFYSPMGRNPLSSADNAEAAGRPAGAAYGKEASK